MGPQESYLTPWDWIGVIVYLGVLIYLGVVFSRRQKDTSRYFVAKRSLPGWAVGISIFATLLSSFTFIAFPGWTYERSWEILMREFMAPLTILAAGLLIIPLYRRSIRISAYEYLERRFGYIARVYGTVAFFIGHFFKIAVVLLTMSIALNSITGWDVTTTIIVLGLITVIYTTFGGIEAVVWTDVIQGLLMLGTGLLSIIFILFVVSPEGPMTIIQSATDAGKFRLVDSEFGWEKETVWVFAAVGFFHFLTKYTTDQTMVQRYLLSPTIKSTLWSMFVSIVCCMLAWIMFSLIGSLLFGLYSLHPDRVPEGIVSGDQMFPLFIGKELPPFVTGLILAGLTAATMSTLSSDLNSIGAVSISDFYNRFAEDPTEGTRLRLSKLIVASSGLASIGMAVWLSFYEGGIMRLTLDAAAIIGSVLSGGMVALFFLGFFFRKVGKQSLYISLIVGFLFCAVCVITGRGWLLFPEPIAFLNFTAIIWWLPIFSNLIVFFLAIFLSYFLDRGYTAPDRYVVRSFKEIWEEEMEPEEETTRRSLRLAREGVKSSTGNTPE